MNKKIYYFIFLIFILLSGTLTPCSNLHAKAAPPRFVDNAKLMESSDETSELINKLDEISSRQQCDVVIITVNTLSGKKPMEYADDYFDYNGYGMGEDKSGILLLVSIEGRVWHISTAGYGITAFTDAGLKYISSKFLPSMKNENYSESFNIFADLCDQFLTKAKTDKPYDKENLPKMPLSPVWIPGSLIMGFLIALFVTETLRKQLKTVNKKAEANDYLKKGSLNIKNSKNIFLFSTISKTPIPKSRSGSSTHTDSSGTSHGGTGGNF